MIERRCDRHPKRDAGWSIQVLSSAADGFERMNVRDACGECVRELFDGFVRNALRGTTVTRISADRIYR